MTKAEREEFIQYCLNYIERVRNDIEKKGAYEEWYWPVFAMAQLSAQYIKIDVVKDLVDNVWKDSFEHNPTEEN